MALAGRDDVRTLADRALADLREVILSGELAPGAPIRLNTYVERLQMSAVPIREALRFLEQQGLIERTPHRGVVVAEMSARDLEDTYRIRLELESMAVRGAAVNMADADRARLNQLVDDYAAASLAGETQKPRARELHGRMHMALYDLAGSKWLSLLLPMLWDNSERYRRMSLPWRGSAEQKVGEHRGIVEACAAGDPDRAEQLLRAHLSNTFEAAILSLQEQESKAAATKHGQATEELV
jgi:DNA-binding GntR family transcriptional regulator